MSLSSALNAARSSLATNASQTSLISRNLAGANEAHYTRKSANIATFQGGVRIESIGRAANPQLLYTTLGATSRSAGQQAVVSGLEKLEQTVGDPEADRSPAALIGALRDAIQQYAAMPDNSTMARAVLGGAHDVAEALRSATGVVQATRQQADADMATSVGRVNELLARLETLNSEIVRGTNTGADVTGKLDARDKILSEVSEQIGIRVVGRADNDIALYTDSGVTLFETTARSVTFKPTQTYGPTTTGNAVFVDGVPVVGGSTTMPIETGKLAGLGTLRDDITVTYQNQLDEIARGLVESFAESDRNAPATLPTIPGLFTYSGAPAMPAGGTLLPGLAAEIAVSPNVDPQRGGVLERLRDGGIGNPAEPAYVYNATGASSFSERLQGMIDALDVQRAFDPSARADENAGIIGFAASSVSWLGASRQSAAAELDYRQTLLARSSEALSNATGVNIDEEMTIMLELERSYQASAKLISTVDGLLASLLEAVG
jgi:flagellar hook-associated protein 1 FlgK